MLNQPLILTAIESNGHRKMKMNQFIIEHLGILRVVVVIYGALKPADLKQDIADPVPGSEGGFPTQLVLRQTFQQKNLGGDDCIFGRVYSYSDSQKRLQFLPHIPDYMLFLHTLLDIPNSSVPFTSL